MGNVSVSQLEECKLGLRRTYEDFDDNMVTLSDYNKYLSDSDFINARMIVRKISEEYSIDIPQIILSSRTVEEFIHGLHYGESSINSFIGNMGYISSIFNVFIDKVESLGIDIKIMFIQCTVPKELIYSYIVEDMKKCEDRINIGDYSGALTSAKSLIEGVCKEIIYNIDGKEIEGHLNMPDLFNNVRERLNLDPGNKEFQKPLKKVLSGLIQVVQGLNEIRNIGGDGHARKMNPTLHHALLVVNSAKTVVDFLFHTYEYQRKSGKITVASDSKENLGV